MINLTLKEAADACRGICRNFSGEEDQQITEIITDSRKADQGCLFIPIKGARVDAHDFIPGVMEKGALCTLSEKELDIIQPYIQVESTLQAIKDIAEYYRQAQGVMVVGITGSVGKTSTKEAIFSVAAQKYNTLKTLGNFNNELGLPFTVFRLEKEHETAILEMGISDFGEMHRLSKVAKPDICVITNIGDCHLENLIDREGVRRAKSEIFDFMAADGKIVLNGDDDQLVQIREVKGIKPVFFGLEKSNDIYAENIENLGLKGTRCQIVAGTERFTVHIPVPGHHMVYNALAAAAVGRLLGLTSDQIAAGIESLQTIGGRNNIIETEELTIIDDCYNANPASMRASLDVLSQAATRRVAVLGDMYELGENETQLLTEVGAYAAHKEIDSLIFVGPLAKHMANGAIQENISGNHDKEETIGKIIYIESKEKLLDQVDDLLEKGDTVLVKASNGMKFQEVVEQLKNK